MSDKTAIEWTDATWNPLVGCTKVSPGCDNCYAQGEVNRRHAAALSPKTSARMLEAFPARFDTVSIRPDRFLTQPLRWARPRRVFVNSLSDLFHADVPDEFIARVFAVMACAPQHTFQLLTKRHARMRSLLSDDGFQSDVAHEILALTVGSDEPLPDHLADPHDFTPWWPLPNVWLGVSVEDQHWADIRIPALLHTPAAVRWISAEPLLGPIDLRRIALVGDPLGDHCAIDALHPGVGTHLDWVVTGGESGPGARPMDPHWARQIRDQCARAGTAYLHKQNGAYVPDPTGTERAVDTAGREYPGRLRHVGKHAAGRELDGRTHNDYPKAVTA